MRNITIGIGIIAITVGVWFFFTGGSTHSVENTETGESDFEHIAELTFTDYDGNSVSLSEFQGKPLVINSWAVWCPFCRQELSDFAELQKEFDDKVVVIAIDRQEPLEKARGYTDELNITDDMLFWLDPSDSFYKSIGGFSMPETLFMNSEGDIVVHKRGPMDVQEMREHTNKILSNII
jgi:cytochrome c biogenesis protein CcmG, thiol:disulfide interchange protein DsbE